MPPYLEFKGLLFKIQHECNLTPHMLLRTFRDTAKSKRADMDAKIRKFGSLPEGDGPKRLKPAEKIQALRLWYYTPHAGCICADHTFHCVAGP
eukprot:gene10023-1806_t